MKFMSLYSNMSTNSKVNICNKVHYDSPKWIKITWLRVQLSLW